MATVPTSPCSLSPAVGISGGLSASAMSSSTSASRVPSRSGATAATGVVGGMLPVASSLIDKSVGKVPNASIGAASPAAPSSSRSTLFGRGPRTGPKPGVGGGAGCVTAGALTGCKGGALSVPLDVAAGGGGTAMRSPLRRRLTVGYSTCRAGRTSGEPLLPIQTFTSSERGSKLTACAPIGSAIVVPIGGEKLKVAA